MKQSIVTKKKIPTEMPNEIKASMHIMAVMVLIFKKKKKRTISVKAKVVITPRKSKNRPDRFSARVHGLLNTVEAGLGALATNSDRESESFLRDDMFTSLLIFSTFAFKSAAVVIFEIIECDHMSMG